MFRIVEAEWPQCRRCQALSCWGSGNSEWVGGLGEGRRKWGQSTSNLIRGRTVPVTAGGRQVSERKYKRGGMGIAMGAKGFGGKVKKEPCRVYT